MNSHANFCYKMKIPAQIKIARFKPGNRVNNCIYYILYTIFINYLIA